MSATEISAKSGIPEDVLREKFGIAGKHIAATDEHVTDMCVSAAAPLLERNDPSEVDAVLYFGSHWKDYLIWQAAPMIQERLGIEGFSIEAVNVSAGAPIALKLASDMLRSDPSLRSILLVGASKESHLLDYSDSASRFMFNFGDGAAAAVMARGLRRNAVLGSSILTDGSFSEHVRMQGGGSKHPATAETVSAGMHRLGLVDGVEMKSQLDPITLKNFLKVSTEALERSGLEVDDIDLLLPIHMKRSLHDSILVELGVEQGNAWYLDHYGHMSAVDPLMSLAQCSEQGKLSEGSVALLLAAGTGYTWAATVIRWGAV
ncbi:MAG TPA: 3-oxoacyl-ACP synthase [Actinomycetota bacterium]|nr:3-oxoacyl-ACP synthase [Actinomycetota bacterium]